MSYQGSVDFEQNELFILWTLAPEHLGKNLLRREF